MRFLIKSLLLPALGWALLPQKAPAQTNIVVAFAGGGSQQFTVQPSGKLYFANASLFIATSATAAPTSYPLTVIQKIYFGTAPTAVETVATTENPFTIAPNPAGAFVTIGGSSAQPLHVRIYSLTGQAMHSGQYLPGEPVPVADLAPGLYLFIVENTPFKLLKK